MYVRRQRRWGRAEVMERLRFKEDGSQLWDKSEADLRALAEKVDQTVSDKAQSEADYRQRISDRIGAALAKASTANPSPSPNASPSGFG